MNEPYTLDELKRRFQELGFDHFVSSIEFDNCNEFDMSVTINLQLIRPVEHLDIKVKGDTPEDRFDKAMELLNA